MTDQERAIRQAVINERLLDIRRLLEVAVNASSRLEVRPDSPQATEIALLTSYIDAGITATRNAIREGLHAEQRQCQKVGQQ